MEEATRELQRTLETADRYARGEVVRPERLLLYVKALNEDISQIDKERPKCADEKHEKAGSEMQRKARSRKRELEHQAADLEAVLKDSEKQRLLDEEKRRREEKEQDRKDTATALSKSSIKLPPIQITPFRGDETKFQGFIDVFEEVIAKKELSDIERLTHLKMCLEGRPKELIEDMPDAQATYKTAVALLKKTYGGKKKVVMRVYEKLHELPESGHDPESLRWTLAKVVSIVDTLRHLGHAPDGNEYLRGVALGKFPDDMVSHIIEDDDEMELSTALERLDKTITARENVARNMLTAKPAASYRGAPGATKASTSAAGSASQAAPPPSGKAPSSGSAATSGNESRSRWRDNRRDRNSRQSEQRLRCAFCAGDHWSDECEKHVGVEARKAQLPGCCHRCLKKDHATGETCKNAERKCYYCRSQEHNRALCPDRPASRKETTALNVETEITPSKKLRRKRKTAANPGGGKFFTFCLTLQPVDDEKELRVRAVIDTASSATLLTERVADALQLKTRRIGSRSFQLLNRRALKRKSVRAGTVRLEPPDGSRIDAAAYIVEEIVDDLPVPDIPRFRSRHPQHDAVDIPDTGAGQPIDVLFGTDILAHLLTLHRSISTETGEQLLSTRYGWLLLEPTTTPEREESENEITMMLRVADDVKTMWELDAVGLRDVEARDAEMEEKALDNFYETVRLVDGRYEISWPWAHEPPPLSENYGLALGRLRSLHRKLRARPDLLKEYDAIIRQQAADEIIELAPPGRPPPGRVCHYIPHHPIIAPDKTTKIRVVYDGSAKASPKDKCLNDVILKGKRWLSDVVTMLLRFRKNEFAVVADIAKAFHQIAIREEDRDAVRFLWLRDPTKEPTPENLQIYRFRRVAFGVVASPFLLHATIHNHLRQEKPETADVISRHMYADNFIASFRRGEPIGETCKEIKEVFNRMKMQLTKWSSNSPAIARVIPDADLETGVQQRVLGINWSTATDQLSLKDPRQLPMDLLATKRRVLKQMASLFDPLGFASPIVIKAKIFLRELWLRGFSWDRKLDEKDAAEWETLVKEIQLAATIEIPRRAASIDCDDPDAKLQLHLFTDDSEKAFAVVVYVRLQKEKEVSVGFIASKSRLVPKNALSMPRLELMAALAGVCFILYLKNAMDLRNAVEIHAWCDNKCALAWIASTKLLATVLERQVREIRGARITQYRYVPSKMNPADVATRGASTEELRSSKWWSGPSWLANEKQWPSSSDYIGESDMAAAMSEERILLISQGDPPRRPAEPAVVDPPFCLVIEEYSSLNRVLRLTAVWIEAMCRYAKKRLFGARSPRDHAVALRLWIRWDQRRHYRDDRTPEIKGLEMFIGPDNLLRCKSRMKNADLPDTAKEPILLVNQSYFTRLLVLQIHEDAMHSGTSYTLAALRENYWLPAGRRTVFRILDQHCVKCRLARARPFAAPVMPPLPNFRVDKDKQPFAATGIDVFGPLNTREKGMQDKAKAWVILFTCLRIRAVHLEPMFAMEVEDFLEAFRKFVARRGVPTDILTDNAPQFHAIESRLAGTWRTFAENEKVSSYMATKKITWHFVPECAPWMGGAYERMVGTVKSALQFTYGNLLLPRRQLDVILAEVEAVVNQRPISYVDRELETPIITPAMFLRATYTATPLQLENLDRDDARKPVYKLWKSTENKLSQFWKNWSRYYLAQLRERKDELGKAYRERKRVPQLGEVVIVAEPDRKKALWRKAIIERLVTSADGVVRTAQIRYANRSRTLRPIVELLPLDLVVDLPEDAARPLNAQRTGIVQPQDMEEVLAQPEALPIDLQCDNEPIVVELGLDDLHVSF